MKKQVLIIILSFSFGLTMAQELTLDSCKSLTLANNKKIIEARLKVEESEQVKKQAFTNYFPHVSGGFVAMKANDYLLQSEIPEANLPVYDGNPANLATASQFAYFPGMDVNLLDYTNLGYLAAVEPVYMGGQVRNGNKLASLGQEISAHELILSEEEAVIKTEEQYWTLVSLKEKMKTIISYEKLLDTLHKDVSLYYDAGLIGRADLLKVELKQNELQGNKLKLQNGIDMVSMALCQNMGIQYAPSVQIISEELKPSVIESYFMNSDAVYQNRQEYQMLQKAVDAEELRKKMARGENMPQMAVGVQGLYLDLNESQTTRGLAFVTLNVPISGWWSGSHEIKQHQIKIEMAENRLAESSELFVLQIEKAYKDLIESHQQISIASKSVEQVQEHLKVTRDNYDAGIVNTSDMLEAQAMFQEAKDNYSDALCTSQIRLAQYKKATANHED
jgi:outer membrane protein TolC